MKIITEAITLAELRKMAALFPDMVKAVVDIDRKIMAADAELHSDLEALLISGGSKQENLWGINLYPDLGGNDFIEFDSMINLRPARGNRSRGVDDQKIRERISEIVTKIIKP